MRPTGGWNSFAIERVESRKEVCQHILGNDDCFQVPGVFAVRIVRNLWTLGPVGHLRTVVVGILESPPFGTEEQMFCTCTATTVPMVLS